MHQGHDGLPGATGDPGPQGIPVRSLSTLSYCYLHRMQHKNSTDKVSSRPVFAWHSFLTVILIRSLFLQWHNLNKLEDSTHWLLILINSPLLIALPEKHCDCLSPICQPCIHNYSTTCEIRISKQDFWSVSVRSL